MNKRILAVLMGLCALCLCACNIGFAEEYKKESFIVFEKNEQDQLTSVGATAYINDAEVPSTIKIENERTLLQILRSDVSEGSDLSTFAMKVSANDASGKTYESDMVRFPLAFGKDYFFRLGIENGYLIIEPVD